jgi:N-acetylglucosaminyl-diphospho-decaprenol L-rhamnosyltransferase
MPDANFLPNLPDSPDLPDKNSEVNPLYSTQRSAKRSINIEYSPQPAALADTEAQLTFQPEASLGPQPLYFLSVNYYSAPMLSDLLHTLEANQGIVIVNNSPSDRVVHSLAAQTYAGGSVTVLDAPDNGGFGAGCNLGLQWIYARSPKALVWLINPDAQLLPQAVSTVRDCFAQEEIAILGTPILDTAGKLWFGAGQFNRWTGSVTSRGKVKADALGRPVPVRWVSGCSMLLNLGLLNHCPRFDERYFLYYEDCDLCERYQQQGYLIAIAPIPLVVHAVSSITGRYTQPKYRHLTFSKLTLLQRHATPLALGFNIVYLSAQLLWLCASSASSAENRAAARGQWAGLQQFIGQFLRQSS